jgi:NAD(P)-dependent dehydrogenase (short-subunit alcohol dehydrogenase family)
VDSRRGSKRHPLIGREQQLAIQSTATMDDLKGKAILITGAARRIGREIALALAGEGADIAITFNTSDREARKTVVEINNLGVRAVALHCDVREEKSVSGMIAEVRRELGGIDVLINNAGAYDTVEVDKITVKQWDDMFATNTRGPFLVSREAARELRKRKGRIVNIGSLGGVRPWSSHAHYCASKAALHMLTQTLAKALAPEIAVNCVAPGMIDAKEKKGSANLKHFAAKTPMRRNGTSADVAAAVRFFASAPQFITGQILTVDGGLGLA